MDFGNWKDVLLENNKYGSLEDETSLYVELWNGKKVNDMYIDFYNSNTDNNPKYNTLGLIHIHIPENMRNQGLCSDILTFLEERSQKNKQHLFVGPFMEEESEYIIKVCEKRNYKKMPPFGMIKEYK